LGIDVYDILKRFARLGGTRLKMAALWGVHVVHGRYVGVFVDSVLACNYRCKMCYFSNETERKKRHGRLSKEQIAHVAHSLFSRTLKLQIGCGAEPTMDMEGALELVLQGKAHKVPYIAMTSNGVRLDEQSLRTLVQAGLNELTVSLHGIHRDTYETMMGTTADYDAFLNLLQAIRRVKSDFPAFNVRVNYTMNADNVDELADFDQLFADVPVNQLQLRPVRRIGESEYRNFDLQHVSECMDTVVRPLAERCRQKGITVLYPEKSHMERWKGQEKGSAREELIALFTYINVTPMSYAGHDVHFETETYDQYARRQHIGRTLFRSIFASEAACAQIQTFLTNSLNYDIR